MRITIVTASFNQGPFIAQAIESVLAQKYADVEHIIVDNCSTDNTSAILSQYSHLKVICEKDKGQSDALNKGFKAATGDVIGWLNADDAYLPQCFVKVAEEFAKGQDVDILYGDYRLVDANGNVIKLRRELSFDLFMLKYLHVLCIPSTTTFFRKRIFGEGNFLDISYHYSMDYDFFLRLALRGYVFQHVPAIWADFRWHEDAKSQKYTLRQKQEMLQSLFMHDEALRAMDDRVRLPARAGLMVLARAKRTFLKICKGCYCQGSCY